MCKAFWDTNASAWLSMAGGYFGIFAVIVFSCWALSGFGSHEPKAKVNFAERMERLNEERNEKIKQRQRGMEVLRRAAAEMRERQEADSREDDFYKRWPSLKGVVTRAELEETRDSLEARLSDFPEQVSGDDYKTAIQPRAPPPTPSAQYSRTAENGSYYGEISRNTGRPKTVRVRGYYRKDGTYVRGHYRSRPRR